MNERLLTAPEVADLLAVPVSWVREATRNGQLPHLQLGRYRRYQRTDIARWLEDQKAPRSQRPPPTCKPGHEELVMSQ